MQVELTPALRDTAAGRAAEAELRKCVHCGFCNATCPTYQLLGDERDGPRGRIYLIKQVLEGATPTERTRRHLDRCLSCRACETTCPSGVEYHRLLDLGRAEVERLAPRPPAPRGLRRALGALLVRRAWFTPLARLAWHLRAVLPRGLRRQLGPGAGPRPQLPAPARRMLLLSGCVQPGLAPNINAATARVLARAGIALIEPAAAGCCGALRFHLGLEQAARADMRALVDAWWPEVERGVEAIVVSASGCGAHLRDLGRLLADEPAYAARAAQIAARVRDVAEVVEAESGAILAALELAPPDPRLVAFQSPCTLQHGLRLGGGVELLLKAAGFDLAPVADAHLCCGSAGTYSLLQRELAGALRTNKLAALSAGKPDLIATANIGCLTHLAAASELPVRHWIELLDERLASVTEARNRSDRRAAHLTSAARAPPPAAARGARPCP